MYVACIPLLRQKVSSNSCSLRMIAVAGTAALVCRGSVKEADSVVLSAAAIIWAVLATPTLARLISATCYKYTTISCQHIKVGTNEEHHTLKKNNNTYDDPKSRESAICLMPFGIMLKNSKPSIIKWYTQHTVTSSDPVPVDFVRAFNDCFWLDFFDCEVGVVINTDPDFATRFPTGWSINV